MDVGPQLQADGGANVPPRDAAIGKGGGGCPYRLPDREVRIVGRHADLAHAHPDLSESRIDVDERRAARAAQNPGVDPVMEVEQQIGLSQHVPGGRVGPVEPLNRSIVSGVPCAVAARVQQGALRHAKPLHPLAERRQRV